MKASKIRTFGPRHEGFIWSKDASCISLQSDVRRGFRY
jgi:hypothetical protein